MTLSLGVDVEKGEGLVVFVDFVTGDFALNDLSENATHCGPFWRISCGENVES